MSDGLDVLLPRSAEEIDQPKLLSRALEPFTRSLLKEAGLQPAMHVLNFYSNVGDLAFLAREMVGSAGSVTGFDIFPGLVAHANERAAWRGLANVNFVDGGIENLPLQAFDALIGRNVLMYRSEPADDLRTLIRSVRPGGLVVFQELDLLGAKTVPLANAIEMVREWLLDTFTRAGVELEMGPKLYATFKAAGLPAPRMRVDAFIGDSESELPAILADAVRTLLPEQEAGVSTPFETLEEKMRADLRQTGGVIMSSLLVGAWVRLPN